MTPNIEKIWENIEPNDTCEDYSCRHICWTGKHKDHRCCDATHAYECPRAKQHEDDVREFIRKSADMLYFIRWA